MIIKKLRKKRRWSQDHLATLSGLSLRTIQRVEAGHAASMETINSLSSVFETDITNLTEEIDVIDKDAETWKETPLWVRMGVWGIRKRSTVLKWELICFFIGCLGLVGVYFHPFLVMFLVFWGSAYWYAVSIRWIDSKKLWL
ncbi:MAG: helix-turn-helix domain-containing protein [Pseudomonadota bacterium]